MTAPLNIPLSRTLQGLIDLCNGQSRFARNLAGKYQCCQMFLNIVSLFLYDELVSPYLSSGLECLMVTRRTLLSFTVCSLASHMLASVPRGSRKLALYVSNGPEILHYDVDLANAVLIKRGSITCPAPVQYAWPHVSRRCLYAICSDMAKKNYVTALNIDPLTGGLSELGAPVLLPARPIHISTDIPSDYILIAFNRPSGARVFRVNKNLSIGDEIPEPGITDGGIYAHQIRVTLDNRHAILVTRGITAKGTMPEDPGALKIFNYKQGLLFDEASIAPNGGIGFGPRHLDFHPTKPWVYVSLERESKLFMYKLDNGRITSDAMFSKDTVQNMKNLGPRQLAGGIHVHPNGRFVYVSNRNDTAIDFKGKKIFPGGENTIVVYAINQTTGEPTAIQFVDTRKIYPRTFSIDPDGRLMTVHHVEAVNVRDGDNIKVVPAGVTVFRIGLDGELTYVRGYDMDVTETDQVLWGGMVQL